MTSSVDTSKSSEAQPSQDRSRSSQSVPTSSHKEIYEGVPIPFLKKLYRGITTPTRLLPDFLVIGTQRGGTTSLYRYLKAHPCIGATSNKDLHFFDRRFQKGLTWYRGHFPTILDKYSAQHRYHAFATGEASPSYLFHPQAPKRVAQALPHVKLIVLLRNPVSRAYSQYHHAVELGFETLSFEEAIASEGERTRQEQEKILKDERYYSEEYKHRSYLTKGIYVDQLLTWMSFIPREQFLILKSEDFYADPAATFKQVLTFLNLPEVEPQIGKKENKQEFKQYNNNTYSSKMDPAMRKRLIEYFEPHNARLYDFLGVNLGWDR
jgi:Sulfotransferase domain